MEAMIKSYPLIGGCPYPKRNCDNCPHIFRIVQTLEEFYVKPDTCPRGDGLRIDEWKTK